MNPDFFLPIDRESLQRLRDDDVTREDLIQNSGAHHFFGFGLWFRNRFCHAANAPLQSCEWEPDSVSSLFTQLIIGHWEHGEDEWRLILSQTENPGICFSYKKDLLFVSCPDDEL